MTIVSDLNMEDTSMETRNQSKLASSLSFLVGVWIVLSPMWIAVSGDAFVSVIITGIVIIAASIVQYFWSNVLPSWIMGLAAAWLLLATVIYSISPAAAWSQILSAAAVAVLAYWDWAEVSQLQRSGSDHHRTTAA